MEDKLDKNELQRGKKFLNYHTYTFDLQNDEKEDGRTHLGSDLPRADITSLYSIQCYPTLPYSTHITHPVSYMLLYYSLLISTPFHHILPYRITPCYFPTPTHPTLTDPISYSTNILLNYATSSLNPHDSSLPPPSLCYLTLLCLSLLYAILPRPPMNGCLECKVLADGKLQHGKWATSGVTNDVLLQEVDAVKVTVDLGSGRTIRTWDGPVLTDLFQYIQGIINVFSRMVAPCKTVDMAELALGHSKSPFAEVSGPSPIYGSGEVVNDELRVAPYGGQLSKSVSDANISPRADWEPSGRVSPLTYGSGKSESVSDASISPEVVAPSGHVNPVDGVLGGSICVDATSGLSRSMPTGHDAGSEGRVQVAGGGLPTGQDVARPGGGVGGAGVTFSQSG
jgi:hypothetical protein